jgi:CheY-like chemotaxis protein
MKASPLTALAAHEFDPCLLKGKRILIVDDATEIRLILKYFLRAYEPETIEAVDGIDALQKASEDSFDLIIMDIQMPRMDGFQTMERFIAMKYPTPVIAITANASREDRFRYESAGFTKCLSKPFDRPSLLNQVFAALTESA